MIGDYRVTQLEGCQLWRVEQYQQARWLWRLFVAPQWRPLYLDTLWMDNARPAEYDTHLAAVVAAERFEKQDREVAGRKNGTWHAMGQQ